MFKYIALMMLSTSCFATSECVKQLQMASEDAYEMSIHSNCILERNYYAGMYDGLEYAIGLIQDQGFVNE